MLIDYEIRNQLGVVTHCGRQSFSSAVELPSSENIFRDAGRIISFAKIRL